MNTVHANSVTAALSPVLKLYTLGLSDRKAGVRGIISRYVTTVSTPTATVHAYEMEVTSLDDQWLEAHERRREWVDYPTALARLNWKPELARVLSLSSLAPTGR